jgi:hypothetical protein
MSRQDNPVHLPEHSEDLIAPSFLVWVDYITMSSITILLLKSKRERNMASLYKGAVNMLECGEPEMQTSSIDPENNSQVFPPPIMHFC